MHASPRNRLWLVLGLVVALCASQPVTVHAEAARPAATRDVLSDRQWQELDAAVDRALELIASRQQDDGSFEAPELGQPGVTALCVLALLAAGHAPGDGPYGQQIDAALDYIVAAQHDDGLITMLLPEHAGSGAGQHPHGSWVGNYNHGISALALAEAYGMTEPQRARRIGQAIDNALTYTRQRQQLNRGGPADEGGWRYLGHSQSYDADLSVTSWQVMFYRSAKNAGFHVPAQWIDEALEFAARCFSPPMGTFVYHARGSRNATIALAGAGILTFSLGGQHENELAGRAGQWLMRQRLDRYSRPGQGRNRYHYDAFYVACAVHQLGEEPWRQLFPQIATTLIANQQRDGSWAPERHISDGYYGNTYTTALAVLTLSVPYEMLPILQR